MKRVITAVAGGAVVATVAFASASALQINGGALQVGEKSTVCDASGVKANWGLETDTDKVYNVRISDIAGACNGANLFVAVDGKKFTSTVSGTSATVKFPTALDASTIQTLKVWIEG